MELGSGLAGDGESRDERGIFGRWGGVMMVRCGTLCFSSCNVWEEISASLSG